MPEISRHDLQRVKQLSYTFHGLALWIGERKWTRVEEYFDLLARQLRDMADYFGVETGGERDELITTQIDGEQVMSTRTRNQLMRNGVRTWTDLFDTTSDEILSMRNQGHQTLKEVNAAKEFMLTNQREK